MAPLCIRNRARADSTQIMDWKAENPSEISLKRDLDRHNVKNFRCLLVAESGPSNPYISPDLNDRFSPGSSRSGNIAVKGR